MRGRAHPLALVGLVWLAALAWLRRSDAFGDAGLRNVGTGLLLAAGALVALLVFATRRTLALRLRLAVLGVLCALALVAATLVRVAGVSGAMLPELRWRFAAQRRVPASDALSTPAELPALASDDFPGFLGARRDNAVRDAPVAADWDGVRPQLAWRAPIGAGWSAFAVVGARAYTLDQEDGVQRVRACALSSGALAWSVPIDDAYTHVLGGAGPRSTPCVDAGRVYALSAWGRLVCLDADSGALLWAHDLLAEHGLTRARAVERVAYGRANSPLVLGDLVIVPAGGEPGAGQAGLVAFEARSGAPRWQGPPRQVSYSSPVAATLLETLQVLVVNEASLSAHDPATGEILWEYPWPGDTSGASNVSQPVPVGPARVLLTKGYGGGALLLELAHGPTGWSAREVWRDARLLRTKLTNVVVTRGAIFGLDDGVLECVDLASGARRWKEGRYGHGQILLAGELLLVQSEEGEVLALEADPRAAPTIRGRFQALTGKCWANLALAGSLLLLRNAEECAAWSLPRRELQGPRVRDE